MLKLCIPFWITLSLLTLRPKIHFYGSGTLLKRYLSSFSLSLRILHSHLNMAVTFECDGGIKVLSSICEEQRLMAWFLAL